MENWFSRDVRIVASTCDKQGRLSCHHTFETFMDIAGLHAEALGVGMLPMLERHLFWLTVRTKVRFLRRPGMLERATLRTRPITPEALRCVREYRLEQDGEPLILGKTEWAVADVRTGKLRPMADVFPADMEFPEAPEYGDPFVRVSGSLANAEVLGTYTVLGTDVDLGGHMNNAAYARVMLGLIPSDTLAEAGPNGVELVFLAPCFEGETLTFRHRMKDGVREIAAFRPEGKLALLGRVE